MRILVWSLDRIAEKRASPAIRALEMVKFLRQNTPHSISLMGPGEDVSLPDGVTRYYPKTFLGSLQLFLKHDIIIAPSFKLSHLLILNFLKRSIILDAYDPVPLEILEQHRESPDKQKKFMQYFHTRVLNFALQRADLILVASQRQRHWYLGLLSALNRIDPLTYPQDPLAHRLIQLVPFGVPEKPPMQKQRVLKGVFPGIGEDDFVLLWGGGVWNWFDPETAIQAVYSVQDRFPNIRLFFLGMQHPNPKVPAMRAATQAMELANCLGMEGKTVFFNPGWVPFEERQGFLLESDLGLSIHHLHLETEFCFRTRILDYIWAHLPMVVTDGDVWAEEVRSKEVGYVVTPGDIEQLAEVITHAFLHRAELKQIRDRLVGVAEEYTWSHTLTPVSKALESGLPQGQHLSHWKKVCLTVNIVSTAMWSVLHRSQFKI